jgi:hypothetical protein
LRNESDELLTMLELRIRCKRKMHEYVELMVA